MSKINPESHEDFITNQLKETNGVASLVCGVNRKINLGNYETMDIYCSLTLPIPNIHGLMSEEELAPIVDDAAATIFALVSHEVNDRYTLIKGA